MSSTSALTSAYFATCERQLISVFRNKHAWINPLLFFVITVSIFPLAMSPDPQLLKTIAPGILWMAALLANFLALHDLFHADYVDGNLEQFFLLAPYPLPLLVFAKIKTHWLVTGLPLIIISPVLGMILNLNTHAIMVLIASLCLGTPTLSFIGSIGSALTLGIRSGAGMLLALIVLPLFVPVLIFATSAVTAAIAGQSYSGELAILGAFMILAFTLGPITTAAALRIGVCI